MNARPLFLGIALSVLAGAVAAGTSEPEAPPAADPALQLIAVRQLPPTLDVEQAVSTALANGRALAAPQANLRSARARARDTALLAAPTLKISADRDRPQDNAPSPSVRSKFELGWTPPQAGESSLRQQQLDGLVEVSGAELELARERVSLRVRELHATLVTLQELLPLSAQTMALQAQRADTGEQQARVGRRTRLELLELRQQAIQAEDAHEDLRLEQDRVSRQLQALIAPLSLRELRMPTRLGPLVANEPPNDAGSEPPARRHVALQTADARCRTLDAELVLKSKDNGRWVKSVAASYSPPQGDKAPNLGVQLELLLPVTGARNGSEAALEAQREACLAEREQVVRETALQREEAQAELARSHRSARQQLRQLAAAQESQALVMAARSAGRADEVEVLTARITVSEKRQAALRQLLQAELSTLAWRQASGQSLIAAHGTERAAP